MIPERAPLTLVLSERSLTHPDSGLVGTFHLSIYASQISLVVTAEESGPDLHTLRNVVQDLIASLVDSVGYVSGQAYEVELSAVTTDAGDQRGFRNRSPCPCRQR